MVDEIERGARPGLPSEENIVEVKPFAPNRAAAAAAGAPAPRAPSAPGAGAGTYRILRTTEVDPYDPPVTPAQVRSLAPLAPPGHNFRGTARKAAKLSLSNAQLETFDDVAELIDTLPAHRAMVRHRPPITTTATSDRVPRERRNVRVRAAFLYAASRESDNDYHLIVGRDPAEEPVYITMELSGLPPSTSPHFPRLDAARRSYRDFFGNDLPGESYDFYDPPIPIEVEGSLFFDMSHATGSRPGPQSLRPDMPVVWEIHPISRIVFEP